MLLHADDYQLLVAGKKSLSAPRAANSSPEWTSVLRWKTHSEKAIRGISLDFMHRKSGKTQILKNIISLKSGVVEMVYRILAKGVTND